MSRGHQTGQARIATTPGPVGDLQRVTRRELNGAGSNEVGAAHRCPFTSLDNEIMRRKRPLRAVLPLPPSLYLLRDEFLCAHNAKIRGGGRDPIELPVFVGGGPRHPFPSN